MQFDCVQLMVAATLVLLSSKPPAAALTASLPSWVVPAASVAIICREITMSAFREWAAGAGAAAQKAVAVNALGKWKTATQMVALGLLLACDAGVAPVLGCQPFNLLISGAVLLWVSAALAWTSLGVYMHAALPSLLAALA